MCNYIHFNNIYICIYGKLYNHFENIYFNYKCIRLIHVFNKKNHSNYMYTNTINIKANKYYKYSDTNIIF